MGLPLGVLPLGWVQTISRGRCPTSLHMFEFLTLPLRLNPATLWRKLISTACIHNLILMVISQIMVLGESWNKARRVNRRFCRLAQLPPHHSPCCYETTCPSNPPFYSHSWTRPQTLAAAIYPQPRRSNPPFSFYGFRLGCADFNPSCFTLAASCLIAH